MTIFITYSFYPLCLICLYFLQGEDLSILFLFTIRLATRYGNSVLQLCLLHSSSIFIIEPGTKWSGVSFIIYLFWRAVCRSSNFLNTCQPASNLKVNFLWLSLAFGEYLKKILINASDFYILFKTVLAHRRHTWDFMAAVGKITVTFSW